MSTQSDTMDLENFSDTDSGGVPSNGESKQQHGDVRETGTGDTAETRVHSATVGGKVNYAPGETAD